MAALLGASSFFHGLCRRRSRGDPAAPVVDSRLDNDDECVDFVNIVFHALVAASPPLGCDVDAVFIQGAPAAAGEDAAASIADFAPGDVRFFVF